MGQPQGKKIMKPFYNHGGITIYHGDCLEIMQSLDSNSVDSGVTDPPYGISFMGKKWDYNVPKVAIWSEALRLFKPGSHLAAFAGTRTQHRMAINIEDAGFEIRDMICELVDTNPYFEAFVASLNQEQLKLFAKFASVDAMLGWGKGDGFPKSLDVSKKIDEMAGKEREVIGYKKNVRNLERGDKNINEQRESSSKASAFKGAYKDATITAPATPEAQQWEGWGTNLKPAIEPISLARKPISEKTIAANVLKWGTGAINIDGCRVEANQDDPNKRDGSRRPSQHTDGIGFEGFKAQPDKGRGSEFISKGRFPSNVILDGSESVEALFPDTKTGSLSKRSGSSFFGLPPMDAKSKGSEGSASRYFYCAKASKGERGEGNNHPTVKPLKLIRYLIKLTTPPNGIVLDPFGGSGTTAIAAIKESRRCIIIEQSLEYCQIARERVIEALMEKGESGAVDSVESSGKNYQIVYKF